MPPFSIVPYHPIVLTADGILVRAAYTVRSVAARAGVVTVAGVG